MPNARPFAYNTGSAIAGTDQTGNLAIGIPTSGFSSTGLEWWNGPDEDLGYVIAVPVADGSQPTPIPGSTASVGFYRTNSISDSEFINLSEYIANKDNDPQVFMSTGSAKTWLNNNGYWTSYGLGPALLMHLDSSNPSSYSGSGSTWVDLSGNGNN